MSEDTTGRGRRRLEESMATILAAERRRLGRSPTDEELIAFRDRRLPAAESEWVADALAAFPEAARRYLELTAAAPAGTEGAADEGREQRWQAFRERLHREAATAPAGAAGERRATAEAAPPATGAATRAARPRAVEERRPADPGSARRPLASRRRRWLPWAVGAAAVAGVALVVAIRLLPVPGTGAVVNPLVLTLSPVTGSGPRGAVAEEVVPAASELVVLRLSAPGLPPRPGYELAVLDAAGRPLWTGRVERQAGGYLSVGLPPERLPPGLYRLELRFRAEPAAPPLATYELRLAAPGASGR